jgi:hypothetical protein
MRRTYLLIVTAFGEGGTGVLLLVLPSGPLALLLGVDQASPVTLLVSRVAGAALLAFGIACWAGRFDNRSSAQSGLVASVLVYDLAAAALLAYAGWFMKLLGIALWPAVLVHAALAVWCVMCLWDKPRGEGAGTGPGLRAAGRGGEAGRS